MISIRRCALGLAFLLAIMAGSTAQAQTGEGAIYGVTNLDVAPSATNQAIALLKQYRDAALKQPGNAGVTLLQEAGWPNRFVIYETGMTNRLTTPTKRPPIPPSSATG